MSDESQTADATLNETLQAALRARGFALERVNDSQTDALEEETLNSSLDDKPESRLVLRDLEDNSMSPLAVDFTSGALVHRLKYGLSKNQPLGKALGLKSSDPMLCPSVFDATAGLGTDALVMAALGCRVRSVERSPAIFALLQDGKARLDVRAQVDEALRAIASRMSFELGDAKEILSAIAAMNASDEPLLADMRPDVVYLDPMYPEEGRSKSALPKKTMQMFRRLLDGDEDADQLWDLAMQVAGKRVVVKRPMKAPILGTQKPAHSFEGKTARFDLYLIRGS